MVRTRHVIVAVAGSILINLLGLMVLTWMSLPEPKQEESTPETRPAPTVMPQEQPPPEPEPPDPQPTPEPQEALEPAPSQITAPTMESPVAIEAAELPAADFDALAASLDTAARSQGEGVGKGLFDEDGRGERQQARSAGDVDQPPVPNKTVSPRYPLEAERRKTTGYVVVRALVERDGRVSVVEVVDAKPRGVFEEAAKQAFAQWRFEPAEDDGERVRVWVRKRLDFELR